MEGAPDKNASVVIIRRALSLGAARGCTTHNGDACVRGRARSSKAAAAAAATAGAAVECPRRAINASPSGRPIGSRGSHVNRSRAGFLKKRCARVADFSPAARCRVCYPSSPPTVFPTERRRCPPPRACRIRKRISTVARARRVFIISPLVVYFLFFSKF